MPLIIRNTLKILHGIFGRSWPGSHVGNFLVPVLVVFSNLQTLDPDGSVILAHDLGMSR